MKIVVAQLNPMVGAFTRNLARMELAFAEARDKRADLVVFPEQAIAGCPARDLWLLPAFVERNLQALDELARWTRGEGPGVVVGFTAREGDSLFNAAALLAGGEVRAVARKRLLSSDEVFDEARYFQPGEEAVVVEHRGVRIGLALGLEAGEGAATWQGRRPERDPVAELAAAGARLVVHLNASPFAVGSPALREEGLAASARRSGLPLVSCNLVGGNDSLIFDGGSLVIDGQGKVLARAASFREELMAVELAPAPAAAPLPPGAEAAPPPSGPRRLAGADELRPADLDDLRDALHLGLRDYLEKSGNGSVILGLSGGIDSALVAALAAGAIGPSRVQGVLLPSRFTSTISSEDAQALAANLGIETRTVSIEPVFETLLKTLQATLPEGLHGMTEENLQARARGLILMALSNQSGALLLTTGNKSEIGVGYCTLYGDMAGALAPIGDLPKTWVYALSHHLNGQKELIPARTLTRPPTAELREGQRDDESLPPYPTLDRILAGAIQEGRLVAEQAAGGEDEATVRWVISRLFGSEYKRRQAAPSLRVSPRAFGEGWRFPMAHGFKP